ncbi:Protein transport protein SEC13 [Thelohanellus kitauei]|uniref:Protein SEC13 homolog n=1 Tax=Thelohanellus kitauei TaxID=669202 RepID=A0A0C2JTT7_THEKT|nr:Protein transport protein SEC13 [Thelohanellus kitauei]
MELETTVYRQIPLSHSDIVNCTEIDSYGRRLATCSSDKTIHIYDISKDTPVLLKKLTGHEGPVWYCTWSDPSFGTYLATCSYDRKIGVTCLCWGPPYIYNDVFLFLIVKTVEVNAFGDRWYRRANICLLVNKCVTSFNEQWKRTELLNGEQDAVRSVAWTTSQNGNKHHIASAYNNGAVIIWSKNYQTDREWDSVLLKHFAHPVWQVSWTEVGNLLAISCGENQVSMWKRNLDESWCCIKSIDEQ